MGVKKKRAGKKKEDRLHEDDPAKEMAASTKAKPAKKKAKKVDATKVKLKVKVKATKVTAAELKAAGKVTAVKTKATKVKATKKPEVAASSKGRKSQALPDSAEGRKIRVPDAMERCDADDTLTQEQNPFEVAKQKMKGSVPAIVEAMVELAKQGSCSHAKTLLEMTGAKQMFAGEAEAQDSSEPWAKLVLERLDEAESKAKQETAGA